MHRLASRVTCPVATSPRLQAGAFVPPFGKLIRLIQIIIILIIIDEYKCAEVAGIWLTNSPPELPIVLTSF